jgi:hypothetical protein
LIAEENRTAAAASDLGRILLTAARFGFTRVAVSGVDGPRVSFLLHIWQFSGWEPAAMRRQVQLTPTISHRLDLSVRACLFKKLQSEARATFPCTKTLSN